MESGEELFEEEPTDLPTPIARLAAEYLQRSGPEPEVKHAKGHLPFLGFCAEHGVRANELAADPGRLFWFLRAFASELEDDIALNAAAAIFAGNTIAGLSPTRAGEPTKAALQQ